jgi:hypothetical protein
LSLLGSGVPATGPPEATGRMARGGCGLGDAGASGLRYARSGGATSVFLVPRATRGISGTPPGGSRFGFSAP